VIAVARCGRSDLLCDYRIERPRADPTDDEKPRPGRQAPLRSFEVSGGLDDVRGGEGLVHEGAVFALRGERDYLIEILRGALRC
jgi:hypothetical protein